MKRKLLRVFCYFEAIISRITIIQYKKKSQKDKKKIQHDFLEMPYPSIYEVEMKARMIFN